MTRILTGSWEMKCFAGGKRSKCSINLCQNVLVRIPWSSMVTFTASGSFDYARRGGLRSR